MLRISKLTDYATVVMAALAERPDERLSATRLSEITRLETPTVAKVLKALAGSDLVIAYRGVQGGYQLARPAGEISVAAVIRAMEGPIALTECSLDSGICSHEPKCRLRGNWQRIGQAVESVLERLSIVDITRDRSLKLKLRTDITADSRDFA